MTRFLQLLLVAGIAVALCSAEAPRYRDARFQRQQQLQRRNRLFAKQIAEPAADVDVVTPYPSADQLKPEVPFEEAEQAPDQTYGPPAIETDDLPLGDEEEANAQPDVDDSPAVDEEEQEPAVNEEGTEEQAAADEEEVVEQTGRLVAGRRLATRRTARPAKLRRAPAARLQQQLLAQPQVFYYAAPVQAW